MRSGIIASIFPQFISRGDRILLLWLLTDKDLGLYTVAFSAAALLAVVTAAQFVSLMSLPAPPFISMSACGTPSFAYDGSAKMSKDCSHGTTSRWSPGALAMTHLIVVDFMLQAMCGSLLQFVAVVAGANIWRPRLVAALEQVDEPARERIRANAIANVSAFAKDGTVRVPGVARCIVGTR